MARIILNNNLQNILYVYSVMMKQISGSDDLSESGKLTIRLGMVCR